MVFLISVLRFSSPQAMATGLPSHFDVLAIGFLIARDAADLERRLPAYAAKFDAVITAIASAGTGAKQDASFAFVLDEILRPALSGNNDK
jgi:hypothetical protein